MQHHEHHIDYNKILHSKMNGIYFFHSILFFVKSMVGIFVPIYLYSLGFSISQVILYSLLTSLTFILTIPLTTKIINKIGFKFTLLITIPLYILHITTINFIEIGNIFFHLAWISFGIYLSLFWITYHTEIAANSRNKNRGKQIGNLQILTTIVTALAPLLGGFFLQIFNYFILLIISSVILTLSLLPLLLSKDIKLKKHTYTFKQILVKNKAIDKSDKLSFKAEGISNALALIIWPILFFIIIGSNFLVLGAIITLISIITIFTIIILKKKLDTTNKNLYLNKISKALAASWGIRSLILILGTFLIYIVEIISRIIQTALNTTYLSIFYNNAKKKGYLDYIITREINLHFTKILFCIFCIIYLNIFGESLLNLSFVLATGIISSLYLAKIREIV